MKKILLFAGFIVAFIGALVFSYPIETYAGQEHNVSGWAWSENIGWISFNSTNCDRDSDGKSDNLPGCPAGQSMTNYGVNVNTATGYLSGYAWSEHVGWIKFDPASSYPTDPTNPAKLDLSTNKITGWARVCAGAANADTCSGDANPNAGGWGGWVKLNGSNYGVTANIGFSPVRFDNWAFGGGNTNENSVVGWISFSSTNCDKNGDEKSDNLPGCPVEGTPQTPYEVVCCSTNTIPTPNITVETVDCANNPANNGKISLTINKVEGATGYEYKYWKIGETEPTGSNSLSQFMSNSYSRTIGGLIGGANYRIKVRAVGLRGMYSDWVSEDAKASSCLSEQCPEIDLKVSKDGISWSDTGVSGVNPGDSVYLKWTTENIPHRNRGDANKDYCDASGYQNWTGSKLCSSEILHNETITIRPDSEITSTELLLTYNVPEQPHTTCATVSKSVRVGIKQPPFRLMPSTDKTVLRYVVGAKGEIKTSPVTIQIGINDTNWEQNIIFQGKEIEITGLDSSKLNAAYREERGVVENVIRRKQADNQYDPVNLVISTDPRDPARPGDYTVTIKAQSSGGVEGNVEVTKSINVKVIKIDPNYSEF